MRGIVWPVRRTAIDRLRLWLERLIFFFAMSFLLTGNALPSASLEGQLGRIVGSDRFNFVRWLAEAYAQKSEQSLLPIQDYLDDAQRAQFVVDYLDLTRRRFDAEREIDRVYADPNVADPDSATAAQRFERDRLRAELERQRPTLEAIVEAQITGALIEEGFSVGGWVFPPVQTRITPLPHILIVSPRDEIRREPGLGLPAGISVERAAQIEDSVLTQLDKSALVTSIGGLAVYPAMIIETPDLLFLLQTTAHEWVHHWLFFRPLGIQLLLDNVAGGETLTINETVASLLGDEIGERALKHFYPEIARRDYPQVYDPPKPVEAENTPPAVEDPNAFNFNREMHQTRVQVDEYLAEAHALNQKANEADAAGREDERESLRAEAEAWIAKAEAYMEERRKLFVEQGYRIRKLNQAYFAFYGSYADQPGASGADPIGPAVRNLRAKIPGIKDFLEAVSPVTTLADLQRVLAQPP